MRKIPTVTCIEMTVDADGYGDLEPISVPSERAPYLRAELAYWSEWATGKLSKKNCDHESIAERLTDVLDALRYGLKPKRDDE